MPTLATTFSLLTERDTAWAELRERIGNSVPGGRESFLTEEPPDAHNLTPGQRLQDTDRPARAAVYCDFDTLI